MLTAQFNVNNNDDADNVKEKMFKIRKNKVRVHIKVSVYTSHVSGFSPYNGTSCSMKKKKGVGSSNTTWKSR